MSKSLKEEVDKILIDNFNNIQEERKKPNFSWLELIVKLGSFSTMNISSEYVRHRFCAIRKKVNLDVILESNKSSTSKQKYSYQSGKEDKSKGTKEFTFTADNIPTEEEIIEHFNVDITKFRINQIYHKTSFGGKYAITVSLLALKGNQTLELDEKFLLKLGNINPFSTFTSDYFGLNNSNKPKASLLIPKQDAHWNKKDINGDNSIEDRFAVFTKTLLSQLENVIKTNTLEKITYIIGSDEFNSEWTDQTTKGTPQQNILSYQEAFEKISEFNIETIKLLRFYSPKIEVVLLNGNHDHNVSWHLINLLKQVFKKEYLYCN